MLSQIKKQQNLTEQLQERLQVFAITLWPYDPWTLDIGPVVGCHFNARSVVWSSCYMGLQENNV